MNKFINNVFKKVEKMNEEALRALVQNLFNEYSVLDAMADSMADGIALLDKSNKVIKVNKNLTLILQISQKASSIDEIFFDAGINSFVHKTIESQEKCKTKEFLLQGKTENKYIALSILPLVRHKKIIGTVVIVSDITERKMAELKNQRLENLARLATAAASISHEIKNPLAAISIHVQLLEKILKSSDIFFDEKMKKHFDVVKEEIDRLNKVVVDFLFAVRPIKFEISTFSIANLLSSLVSTFYEEASFYNIQIKTCFEENIPLLQGDERLLRQAFMNLIINAKHSMQETGGVLELKSYFDDDKIFVEVKDEGCGISKNLINKIFEPYFTTKTTGSGLGLPLTYKVIKESGGDITVYSKEGEGSIFKVALPIVKSGMRLLLCCDEKQKE